jgi:hypothetical protein
MKNTKKKLELRKQSIAPLSNADLQAVVGGTLQQGFIMKDTVIIPRTR